MSRLLQGDVGSGKTVIALGLAAAGVDAGIQTAIMARQRYLQNSFTLRLKTPLTFRDGLFIA